MRTSYGFLSVLVFSVAFLAAACGGGGGGGETVPRDTTAPTTVATPGSGTYGSVQSVTLTANETATIYYSLNGVDPEPGASNTFSGASPVRDIVVSEAVSTLKFFAVDKSGNTEAVKTESYVIDLVSPSISFGGAPGPIGLLATMTINWQSDEAGTYIVELGGTGTPGSGTQLSSGTVAAGMPLSQTINGTDLTFGTETPLWVYVRDSVGHIGSASVDLALKSMVTIEVGGELGQIAILPGGLKTYVAQRDGDAIAVIDTNPASANFNTIISTVPVGTRPTGIAPVPDGSRVYVTDNGSTSLDIDGISVIDTATDTVAATIQLGTSSAPTGIAVTPDGTRAHFLRSEGMISVLDVNPGSPSYHTVTASIPRSLLLFGSVAVTPDGNLMLVNWQGSIAHGVDLLDVNPASPSFNTIISSPVPVVSGLGGDTAISASGDLAYATDASNLLCRINLQSYAVDATGPFAGQGSFALTPDGTTLLLGGPNSNDLSIIRASDLTVILKVPMGAGLGMAGGIAITPDGRRAYVNRNTISTNSQVVMITLR